MDLRRSMQLVRQRKIFLVSAVIAGVLAGVAYAALKPSMFTSDALVVVPQNGPNIATEVVIATSNPVLSGALANIHPAVSLKTLQTEVQAKTPAPGVITVSAQGRSAADAESIANAVAGSYTSYVGARSSPVGHVAARILEPATSATDTGVTKQFVIYGLTGAIAGVLIGFISTIAIGRGDRRLRERDDIANAIGVPVLASFPVGHPSDAAGWGRLLNEYDPSAVHAWRLRKALQCLRVADPAGGPSSLTILSLSSDPGALAVGPQLAVFAASLGSPPYGVRDVVFRPV
jgi:capsular polysaccharide biosynthesis protein